MTAIDASGVQRIAARAALAVPGVVELQSGLRRSLAGAATHVLRALGSPARSREAGIHAERAPGSGAWHVEARCVVHDGRRVADTAREVHDSVRTAVGARVERDDAPCPVTVVVTVVRITRPPVSSRPTGVRRG